MSELTVQAIVLRRRDSGESDRRLTLLTREQGKIDAIAKGAKKGASRLAGSSDPLSMATMTLAKGKVNQFVTQAQPMSSFRGLRTDYLRLTMALGLLELFAAVLPWGEPDEESFDLLVASLQALEKHDKPVVALVWAELKLLEMSGFLPQFDRCVNTGQIVTETPAYLSPMAGGHLASQEAIGVADRFQAKAEVLFGLARCAELHVPPPNLKFADECLFALMPFWRNIVDQPLPANDSLTVELRHGHM